MNKKAQVKVGYIIGVLVITLFAVAMVMGPVAGIQIQAIEDLFGGGESVIGGKYIVEIQSREDTGFDFDGQGEQEGIMKKGSSNEDIIEYNCNYPEMSEFLFYRKNQEHDSEWIMTIFNGEILALAEDEYGDSCNSFGSKKYEKQAGTRVKAGTKTCVKTSNGHVIKINWLTPTKMEYWFEELNYAYSADDIEPGYVTLDKYLLTVPKEHFVSDKIEGEGGNVKWYGYDFDKQMPTSGGEYELDNLEERSGIDMWYNEEYGLLFDSQCGKEGKYVCCESNVGGTAFTCEFDTEEACQFKCENHCNILGHENNKLTFDAETGKYTCICSTKGRLAWEDYTLLNEKISICEFDKEEDCQEHCKSDCVMAGYEKDNLQWKESQGKYVCTCSEHTTGCPAYMYPHPESACAEDYVQRMDCKGLNEGCEYDEETQICTCPNGYNFQRSFYMGTTDNINCNELPPMFYHPNWQDWGGGSGQPSAYSPPVNKNAYYCIITNENRVVKVQWKSNQGEGGKFEWEYD